MSTEDKIAKPATPEQQITKTEWTPEAVENLIKIIDKLAEKYITYKREEAQADNRYVEIVTFHNRLLTLVLSLFLVGIVGLMSFLVLQGKVSGDALLFLVGTITGYVILFIQRLIGRLSPSTQAEEEE